jgi:hypothetical protein
MMASGMAAARGGQLALNLPERRDRVPDRLARPSRSHAGDGRTAAPREVDAASTRGRTAPLCAGCRQHEARYGFRVDDADPADARPRTLCFSCFRVELDYRQAVAAQLARGWNAEQARLPLEDTLREIARRRRRAQIAARHALDD